MLNKWPTTLAVGLAVLLATLREPRANSERRLTRSPKLCKKPGPASSAFVLGGIFGLLIGIALNQSDMLDRRWL